MVDSGFAMPNVQCGFEFPVVDPNNPMNYYYLNQAQAYAQSNPSNVYAQRLLAHWMQAMRQIEQARAMQMAQLQAAQGAAGQPPLQWPPGMAGAGTAPSAPVPSNLLPTPTPPSSGMGPTGAKDMPPFLHQERSCCLQG